MSRISLKKGNATPEMERKLKLKIDNQKEQKKEDNDGSNNYSDEE